MHHSGNDQPIDIAQNFVERVTLLGRLRRNIGENRARLMVRRHAQRIDILSKIRNPIRERVQLPAKFFRRRVAQVALLAVGMYLHGLDFH